MAASGAPWLSVIVPARNEPASVQAAAAGWQALRRQGHELILVDGDSADGTAALAGPHVDRVLPCAPGRARQMNAGAAAARGRALLFLHVDTRLPAGAADAVRKALAVTGWGRFDVRIDAAGLVFRVIERAMNARSRLTGIATGDQAIFVDRELFESVGGFPDIALMEDIALSAALRARARPACLRARVQTSARRWRRHGVLRTVVLMWRLRIAFALGAAPSRLARLYDPPTGAS